MLDWLDKTLHDGDVFFDVGANVGIYSLFHQLDQTIRGHVFCSFLVLVPRKELERRLEKNRASV